MPEEITPLTIHQLLGPHNQADNINNRPAAPTTTAIVNRMAAPNPPSTGAQHPTEYIIDDMVGDIRGAKLEPNHSSPCFLHSRKQGFWIVTRGRRLSLEEALRLQGYNLDHLHCPTNQSHLHQLLGNTMSHNVVQRILIAALHSAGLYLEIKDPWTNGTAQAELTAHATRKASTRFILNRPIPPPDPQSDIIIIDEAGTDHPTTVPATTQSVQPQQATRDALARIRHFFSTMRAQRDCARTREQATAAHHNSITLLRRHIAFQSGTVRALEPSGTSTISEDLDDAIPHRNEPSASITTNELPTERTRALNRAHVAHIRKVFQTLRDQRDDPHSHAQATAAHHNSLQTLRRHISFQSPAAAPHVPFQNRNPIRRRRMGTPYSLRMRQQAQPPDRALAISLNRIAPVHPSDHRPLTFQRNEDTHQQMPRNLTHGRPPQQREHQPPDTLRATPAAEDEHSQVFDRETAQGQARAPDEHRPRTTAPHRTSRHRGQTDGGSASSSNQATPGPHPDRAAS